MKSIIALTMMLFSVFIVSNSFAEGDYWQQLDLRKDRATLFREDKDGVLYFAPLKNSYGDVTDPVISWSVDNGKSWSEMQIPFKSKFTVENQTVRVAFIVSNRALSGVYIKLYIYGETSKYFHVHPVQGQLQWREIPTPPSEAQLEQFAVSNTGVLYAMKRHEALYRSQDDGKTWVDIGKNIPVSGKASIVNGFQVSSTGTIVVHSLNFLYVSNDEGETFRRIRPPSKEASRAYSVDLFAGQNGNVWAVYRSRNDCPSQAQIYFVFKSTGDLSTWRLVDDWPIVGNEVIAIQENSLGDLMVSQNNFILEEDFYCGTYFPKPVKNFEQFPGLQINSPRGGNTYMLSAFSSSSRTWRSFISVDEGSSGEDEFIVTEKRQMFFSPHRWPPLYGPGYRIPLFTAVVH